MQAPAVFSNDPDGGLSDVHIAGYVESHEVRTVGDERDQAPVGQALAVGQGQPFDAVTDSQGLDASVINFICEAGQVKAFDELGVGVVRAIHGEGPADQGMFGPRGAGRAVPEQLDGVLGPALAREHDIAQICRDRQLGEDAYKDLVWQALYGRQALVLIRDLHVLQIGNAE